MNVIAELAGELCKVLLPIDETVYFGNPDSRTAICVLSSMNLLKEIKNSQLINKISIVGRLLSENKGIDSLVKSVLDNNITTIILCGKDTTGHKPGHSLLCLHKNGVDQNNRIIESHSPDPIVTLSQEEISKFQNQVSIVNQIGNVNVSDLESVVKSKE